MQAEAALRPVAPPSFNDDDDTDGPSYPRPLRTKRSGFPYKLALGALVILAIAAGVLHAFAGAKVDIVPVVNATNVSGEFVATATAGDLPFAFVTAETIATIDVPAEGTTEANDAAQGSITVFNDQKTSQPLIKNTRFESPSGLIYRIRDSITLPPKTGSGPGKLTVTVYADEGGEKYNIGPTSFTIPGLKGSETYDLVYARSESAMTGGFSGTRPSVGNATKEAKYETLKPTIDAQLRTALLGQLPEGYVLLGGATWITYEPQPDGSDAAGTVTIKEKGMAKAVIFPKGALAKAIAYLTPGTYDGQSVTFNGEPALTVSSTSGSAPAESDESFTFTLTGTANILWVVDAEKIAGAVAGKSRDAAKTILVGFPEVAEATFVLRPFWAGQYPSDPKEIKVNVGEPAAN